MCRAHIALLELEVVGMILHRMVFCLSGKVVALHLDNSTAKAYLCNQGGTVSPFLSRLVCQILSLTNKHGITLLPACIPTHLNVEANYLCLGSHASRVASSPSGGTSSLFTFGAFQRSDLLASFDSTQCQHYYTMESPLPLGPLGLNAFNHPVDVSGKLHVSSSGI